MQKFINKTIKPVLIIGGLGTAAAGVDAFFPRFAVENVQKLAFIPDYTIFVQHWGIMVCLMGVFMVAAAFIEAWRVPILLYGMLEKAFMVYLVGSNLGQAFADRGLEGSGAMPRLYEAGLHGRKNGRGFYLYPKTKKKGKKDANPKIYGLLGGEPRRSVDVAEIQDRLALLMVNEAVHCLQEGVISSPRDGDLGAILGLGFPPFRGGPFRHTDAVGRDGLRARLEKLAGEHGKRFEPAESLKTMAKGFYDE